MNDYTEKIKELWENIPDMPLPDPSEYRFGQPGFHQIKELQVGIGDTSFKADKSGIWLGANAFADANFSVDMAGNVIATALSITGGSITGATIQTALTGKRLKMAGSPANEYQFLNDDTDVGHLKIDDDGAGGYYAEIYIDNLAAFIKVGSTVGASEHVYFETVGFESAIRAAVGTVLLTSKDGFTFGFEWSGGGDPLLVTNALPASDPGVSGALWNDAGYVAVSP